MLTSIAIRSQSHGPRSERPTTSFLRNWTGFNTCPAHDSEPTCRVEGTLDIDNTARRRRTAPPPAPNVSSDAGEGELFQCATARRCIRRV